MTDDIYENSIVIDNGSGTCKIGFSGDEKPKSVFPAIIGRPKYKAHNTIYGEDFFVGDEACSSAGILNLKYPIDHGVVIDWDDMEKIWDYAIHKKLNADPTKHAVLLTEAPLNPRINREKMAELMFEKFKVPALYVGIQAILSLYASGRTTGLVLESGDGVTQAFPVYEAYTIKQGIRRRNLGGSDVTAWMTKLLAEKDHVFNTTAEKEIVRDLKEKLCYVALDFDAEMKNAETSSEINRSYQLPDDNIITIGNERFRCPELLFKPYLNGYEYEGIDKLLFDSIINCDINARKDLYENIILSGGNTKFGGFADRIKKEITALAPPTMRVKVVTLSDYYEAKDVVWVGGSILASLATFPQKAITKDEFEEAGAQIVHRKCF